MDIPVYQYDMLDSTNTQCRRLAAEGVMDAVVTADCQTAGRGRMGRSFQSPPGLGLYLACVNAVAFLAFAADKARAALGRFRIRETALLSLALAGGAMCALAAMHL